MPQQCWESQEVPGIPGYLVLRDPYASTVLGIPGMSSESQNTWDLCASTVLGIPGCPWDPVCLHSAVNSWDVPGIPGYCDTIVYGIGIPGILGYLVFWDLCVLTVLGLPEHIQ